MVLINATDVPHRRLARIIDMTGRDELDWMSCVEHLHDAFGSDSSLMYAPPYAGRSFVPFLLHKVDLSRIGSKAQKYATKTPFLDEAIKRGLAPGAFFDRDVLPADFNDTDHNRDIFKAIDWTDGLQFVLRLPTAPEGGLVVKLWRFHPTAAFDEQERELALRVFPHLVKASEGKFTSPPAHANSVAPAALDQLSTAFIIFSVRGEPVYSNAAAQSLLARGDVITSRNNRVEPLDIKAARSFRQAVEQAATEEGKSIEVVLPRGDDHAPVLSIITSIGNAGREGFVAEAAAIAYFVDIEAHEGHEVQASRAQILFGLTDAEREVLRLLLDDLSIEEISGRRNSAVATVRTQVKAILQKTRKHRQRDLLQLRRLAI